MKQHCVVIRARSRSFGGIIINSMSTVLKKTDPDGCTRGPLREPAPEKEKTTHCDVMYAQGGRAVGLEQSATIKTGHESGSRKGEATTGRKAGQWGPHAFGRARVLLVRHVYLNRVSVHFVLCDIN